MCRPAVLENDAVSVPRPPFLRWYRNKRPIDLNAHCLRLPLLFIPYIDLYHYWKLLHTEIYSRPFLLLVLEDIRERMSWKYQQRFFRPPKKRINFDHIGSKAVSHTFLR